MRGRTAELQRLNARLSAQIDERHSIERALQVAKADAERANLGKTEFLAAACHDLMQPINVARLFVDAIAERPLEPQTAQMLERVDRSLHSAEDLLRTLLDMSRLDAGAMRADLANVALDPLLRRLASEYGYAAEERGLRLRVIPCDAVIRTDARLFERVVRNLLDNALRYTRAGGVLVGGRYRGDRLRVEVWDTGSGIPAENLTEIFKEFRRLADPHRSDATAPGMGLGLAIVERIARLLGATIDVRSREGRGSVFGVSVPLAPVGADRSTTPSSTVAAGQPAFAGRTIFIVEAEIGARELVGRTLTGWGMRVVAARSISDAVAVSRGGLERPSAIVTDYHLLDGASGVDAVDAVRACFACARIPAIVMCSAPTEAIRRHVAERGFGYLDKPLRVERLRSLLAHVMAVA